MSSTAPLADTAAELARSFAGQILRPADPGYEEARRVHNGLIDKRPALIARCRGVADVADALKVARDRGLEVAVRGGGHNVAGRSTTEGGLMVDLSLMRGVHVDPRARTARAEGGATWNGFNRETQLHGLATTGGVVSSTGVAGLTLGGGLGWLMGKHALALDNLLSADVVLADGRAVTASAEQHPDLFWALRGGGGNFGVVASFEYRLHPVGPMVTGGLIAYPFAAAWDVLRHFRDVTASLPDEFTVFAGLVHAPDGSGEKLAALVLCHCGTLAEGEAAVGPLKRFGRPAQDAVGPMPYVAGQRDAGRGLPARRAELLEVELPVRPQRRRDPDDDRVLRGLPDADGAAAARALPRRGHPRGRHRHRLPAPRPGLQPARALGVDGPGPHRGLHRLGAGLLRRAAALHGRPAAT